MWTGMVMLIMSFSNVPKKKKERRKIIFSFYIIIYVLLAFHVMIHFLCVCLCVWFLSTFHSIARQRKKKKIWTIDFLACMLCFPKSGNLPFDISLIIHTYARGCTCTDYICKKQFSGMPPRALNWEKHTEYTS